MNDLIQIIRTQIGVESVNSVNARDVYSYLEVKSKYNDWIQRAIEKYDFEENVDYSKMSNGTARGFDHIVTIDMAKELCMVSNTEKGKETRKYFISTEKKLRDVIALPDFTNPAIAARAWADEVEAKLLLEHKIVEKDKVIVAIADLNIKAGDVSVGDFAKNLAIEGLGRNNMYTWLKGRGFLQLNNEPYQQYVERGYFKRKPYDEQYGGEVKYKTVLTPKGTVWVAKMLKAEYDLDIVNVGWCYEK